MKKIALSVLALMGVVLCVKSYAVIPAANIRLQPNQQMVDVTLAANATTGYQWFVQYYDHDLLSLQNYRYVPNSAKKGMTGVGGVAVFNFAIDPRFYDAPQMTNVTFVYQQPWSPGKNTATAQVTISSISSSNDLNDWQKYPQLSGPAAEVQASEASLSAQYKANAAPATPLSAQVPLPAINMQQSSQVSSTAAPNPPASSNTQTTTTPTSTQSATPVGSANSSMPAGTSTPDTNNQTQWLNLPASANTATTSSPTATSNK
jgi:inhibitor of cysteine peptidase